MSGPASTAIRNGASTATASAGTIACSRRAMYSALRATGELLDRGQHNVQPQVDQVHPCDGDRGFTGQHHATIDQPVGELQQRHLVRSRRAEQANRLSL